MTTPNTDRNAAGHFLPGNTTAQRGGQARAAKLSPARRQEIAQAGWQALVAKRFAGDEARAADYIGRLGAWAAIWGAPASTSTSRRAHVNRLETGGLPANDSVMLPLGQSLSRS